MHRAFVFMCALAVAPVVQAADTHPFSVQDMLAMDRISDPQVSPDGRWVAFTVSATDMDANKRRADIYVADVRGTETRRLTRDPAADTNPRWAPDGRMLYFLSTRSGSQQVWQIDLQGGEPSQITREPLDVENLEIAPGGKGLIFSMAVFTGATPTETQARVEERTAAKSSGRIYDRAFVRHWDSWNDGTRNHVFAYALPAGPARDLMPAMDADCPSRPFGGGEEFAVSPDGAKVVFSTRDVGREEPWSTNFDLYEVAFAGGGAPKKLTASPAWDTQPRFSPDGKTLAYLAMDRPGFEADRLHFVLRNVATGAERSLDLRVGPGPRGDRSPAEFTWSPDGRELWSCADHLGQHPILATDVASGRTRIVAGHGTTLAPRALPGGRILYGMHSLQGPTELYSVAARGGATKRVTHLNDERVAAARFGKAEQYAFTGAHGDSVYSYFVYPADFDPARKYPLAFLVHGGPQGSFGNDFHYRWNPQAYAGAGYAVLMVDFHGSTGYGQAFTDAIRGDWGGAPYQDLMLGLDDALARYGFIDRDRIGALGASYGGYMINWIAGNTDRFKTLVNHDGTLDERMAYFDTEELWFPEWEHGGTPWQNPAAYAKHNPVERVDRWKTPMLVVHSAKDFRVVETQGLSTFNALQRRGIPSKLLYFPDENHWVLKPQNSKLWHDTVIAWLDQWLKRSATAAR